MLSIKLRSGRQRDPRHFKEIFLQSNWDQSFNFKDILKKFSCDQIEIRVLILKIFCSRSNWEVGAREWRKSMSLMRRKTIFLTKMFSKNSHEDIFKKFSRRCFPTNSHKDVFQKFPQRFFQKILMRIFSKKITEDILKKLTRIFPKNSHDDVFQNRNIN